MARKIAIKQINPITKMDYSDPDVIRVGDTYYMIGPRPGGLQRLLVSDKDNPMLGCEGSHIYKINGKYYLFFDPFPAGLLAESARLFCG